MAAAAKLSGEVQISGTVAPGFEPVRDALRACFDEGEVGVSVCVLRDGEPVVDLWAGQADVERGAAWQPDTLGVVFSATKGMVALAFLMIAERGLVDVDAPIVSWWPEFGANGKQAITLRQCLNHRAGLHALNRKMSLIEATDPGVVEAALIAQSPAWTPGTDQGYGATAWGILLAPMFRRLTGRSIGAFLHDEVAVPLGVDLHLGLPERFDARVAKLYPAPMPQVLRRFGWHMPRGLSTEGRLYRAALFDAQSPSRKAFFNPDLGPERLGVLNQASLRRLEMPWMGMYTTARSLARVYAALAAGGQIDGVRIVQERSLLPLHHPQSWSNHDRVLHKPMGFSLGFQKEESHLFSPDGSSFGHSGVGGALGFADPHRRLAFAYVPNGLDPHIRSPRCVRLCHAMYRSVGLL